MRGTQKRDKKNHVIVRVQKFGPAQIKYVRSTYYFFKKSFFPAAPCTKRTTPNARDAQNAHFFLVDT
jgi:hypothetical protein